MPIANPMARTSKVIGFKAFHDCDNDILGWWESMPNGERSHILRTLIRAYLSGQVVTVPVKEDPLAFANSVQLAQLRTDTLWIRDAMREIPDYLERLVAKSEQSRPSALYQQVQMGEASAISTNNNLSIPALTPSETERRAARIKQTQW